jgi:BASS family bile acid:Na+ symporter
MSRLQASRQADRSTEEESDTCMTTDRLINILVTITLVEMMVAVGLGVRFTELIKFIKKWRLVLKAGVGNYICVPAIAVALLLLFNAAPMVAAGFLILAVCPGAPFAPSCTSLAKGNVAVAVGLMVILAASSAILAPALLQVLLRLTGEGNALQVDVARVGGTLLLTQLLPLCVGISVRHWWSGIAERLQKPASLISAMLGLATVGTILVVHFQLLIEIRLRGYLGMSALLVASWVVGWLLGGPEVNKRKALSLTTSLRNVGVGLVIATGNFGGTAAVTTAVTYGIVEILGSLLLAFWWGHQASYKVN